MKVLYDYWEKETGQPVAKITVAMSARKNLCVNEPVAALRFGNTVDSACQKLTASSARQKRAEDPSLEACDYFENFEAKSVPMQNGVWNLVQFWAKTDKIEIFSEKTQENRKI